MIRKSNIILDKEKMFLMGFSIYLIQSFLRTTMFTEMVPSILFNILRLLGIGLVLFKIIFDKYTIKKIAVIFITVIMFFFTLIESTYSILLEYAILIIGAKDVSFKKIINIYFKINMVLLLITIISSKIGIIEDLVYYRAKNDRYRHSFGVVYPTDFAAHVFFLCLAYFYLKGKNIKWYQILLVLLSAIFVYYYCDARLDAICIILVVLMSLVYKFNLINFKNWFIKYGLIFSFLICEILSIYLTINYNPSNSFYAKINDLLSSRLRIGNMMYDEYGIKIFGQKIEDHGYGGSLTFEYDTYNYIDCSYLRILLKYGLATSIILTLFNLIISKKMYRDQNYDILLILLLISINSIVAQHYIDFSYNFLLLAYLARLEDKK